MNSLKFVDQSDIGTGGRNAPVNRIDELDKSELSSLGMYRFQEKLANSANLDYLLDYRGANTLVVVLHGATDRKNYEMPRFEWLGTMLSSCSENVVYFSDPVLSLDEKIQLAWYTGWKDLDAHKLIADRIQTLKQKTNSSNVLIVGSSGGGFASLMISSYLTGSFCAPMNAQTAINAYFVDGVGIGPQRFYAERVMSHLVPNGLDESIIPGWTSPMEERLSAVERYKKYPGNHVLFVQNVNDFHFEQHYLPFVRSAVDGGIGDNLRTHYYKGSKAHVVPTREIFSEQLSEALTWCKELS